MTAAVRKTFGLLAGILIYYLIHEGAHLVLAMAFGVFQEVRFLELGVQIAITSREALSDLQFAAFNAAGAGASLAIAYLLVLSAGRINRQGGKSGRLLHDDSASAQRSLLPVRALWFCGRWGHERHRYVRDFRDSGPRGIRRVGAGQSGNRMEVCAACVPGGICGHRGQKPMTGNADVKGNQTDGWYSVWEEIGWTV